MVRLDQYTRRVVIAFSIGAVFFIAWRLSDVFVLLFGGLILATALRAVAGGVARLVPLPERGALAVVVVGLVALLGVAFWLIGGRVAIQFEELRNTLPRAITAASEWLNASQFGLTLLEFWESAKEGGVPWSRVDSSPPWPSVVS